MNFLGLSIITSAAQKQINTAIIRLAQLAGVHINLSTLKNPMNLSQSSVISIITAVGKTIIRLQQAQTATAAALETALAALTPLERENSGLKVQRDTLRAVQQETEDALLQLREVLPDPEKGETTVEEEVVEGNEGGASTPNGETPASGTPSGNIPVSTEPQIPSEGNASTTGGTPSGEAGEKGPAGTEGTPSGN